MVAGNLNHPDGQPTTPGSGFPIPPGYGKPGYKPESKVGPYIGVTAVLTLIMVTVVVLRVYTRIAIARSFGWDDGLIVAAAVATVGMHAPYGFRRRLLVI
jgi:hypothetical protein